MSFLKDLISIAAPVVGGGIGALFGGPAGAAAGVGAGGAITGFLSQQDTNEQSIASAREQMAFQERMSNTSYQRGMEDMRRAGLNPILAADKGGASTPGGAQPSLNAPDISDLGKAAVTALEMKNLQENTNKVKADTELTVNTKHLQDAQAQVARSNARMNSANAVKAEAEAEFYKNNPWAIPLQQGLNMGGSAIGIATGVGKIIDSLKEKTKLRRLP